MTLNVIQDWQDRCAELLNRSNMAAAEAARCSALYERALLDEPRVCETCSNRGIRGECAKFSRTPPKEFAETPNACAQWEVLVPF
jgi:hypothetical protein